MCMCFEQHKNIQKLNFYSRLRKRREAESCSKIKNVFLYPTYDCLASYKMFFARTFEDGFDCFLINRSPHTSSDFCFIKKVYFWSQLTPRNSHIIDMKFALKKEEKKRINYFNAWKLRGNLIGSWRCSSNFHLSKWSLILWKIDD